MRKPDKQRYLRSAVRHEESDEIPFFEQEIETTVAGKILGKELPKVRPYEIPVEEYVRLNLLAGNDMLFWSRIWELGRKNHIDEKGRKQYMDGTFKTRQDLKRITYPDLGELARGLEELLAAIEGTGMGLVYTPSQESFIVTTAIGYQDYYEYMITDPAFIHEFQKRVTEHCARELELALKYPIDAVQVGAVLCSKSGPLFSKEMMEEFEFPSLRARVQMVKSKSVPVSIHQDGNVTSLYPEFIKMGIDIINPIETCDGAQDIFSLKEKYGAQIALHGNIDMNLLAFGSQGEIKDQVTEHCRRLSAGGGYVCASSHNITEAIPVTNFFAMRDAVHDFKFTGTCITESSPLAICASLSAATTSAKAAAASKNWSVDR
ncbi:MAG: hypothetical protein KAI66_24930 [Lentisphaeria bacterium]|nr:hypothetical protein [Lentisphaeria bacterium]